MHDWDGEETYLLHSAQERPVFFPDDSVFLRVSVVMVKCRALIGSGS